MRAEPDGPATATEETPGAPGADQPVNAGAPAGRPPEEPGGDDLSELVSSGLRWSLVSQGIIRLSSFLTGVALARILAPEDLGVFAVALTAVNVLMSMNDLGLILAVVRWPGDIDKVASTAVTLIAASSVVLYGACWVGAPFLATLMGAPHASGVLRLISLVVVVDGLCAVPSALLMRAFRQARATLAQVAGLPVSVVLSIVLAKSGAGAWSLAWGHLAGHAVTGAALFALAPARPRPGFDRRRARELLAFGCPVAATTVVSLVLVNVDYVMVGRALGPVALGFYVLAFNVSNWPVAILTETIRRVSVPGFSRLSGDRATLVDSFNRSAALLVAVTAPMCLLLALLAGPIVRVLYGSRWSPAISSVQFLAFLGGVRVLTGFVFDVMVGAGRPRTTLWLKLAWLAALVPALAVGTSRFGIRGAAAAHLVVAAAVVAPLFLVALHRLGIRLAGLALLVVRPLVGMLAGAMVGATVVEAARDDRTRLIAGGLAALAVYAAFNLPFVKLARNRLSPSLSGAGPSA